MSWLLEQQRAIAGSLSLGRAMRDATPDERGDAIIAAVDAGSGLGLDQDLRHLSGQVRRQAALPREASRDSLFLLHLEHALRDLALAGAGVR